MKGTPPIRVKAGHIPRRIHHADFRLLDQPVVVYVVIHAGHFIGEIALDLIDPIGRYDLQRLKRFDLGLDIGAVCIEVELLVAGGS
ncbi:hypothetical protein D3C81_2062600 [compost metagenome]